MTERPPSLQLDGDTVYVDRGMRLTLSRYAVFDRRGRPRFADAEVLQPYQPGDSLWLLAAEGNCRAANQLGKSELLAVWWCCINAPFPLGEGMKIYRNALAVIETEATAVAEASLLGREPAGLRYLLQPAIRTLLYEHSLGALRWHLVDRAGEGFNAPTDSYLRIAAELHVLDSLPELADTHALSY